MNPTRPLGISTSLVQGILGTDFPPSALGALAHTPIRHMEYFCMESAPRFRDDAHIALLKATAGEHGLTWWSVHAPFDETDLSLSEEGPRRASVASVVRALDVACELGAGIVVVHGSKEPVTEQEREGRLVQLVRSLNELCKRASQRGLHLALETLPRSCLGNRTAEVRRVLDIVDGDLRVCYDVNHVTLYEEVGASVRALADRTVTLHLSDHDGVDERHWIPGKGVVDWPGFVAALDGIGYEGCLMHEARDADLDLPGNLAAIAQAARSCLPPFSLLPLTGPVSCTPAEPPTRRS